MRSLTGSPRSSSPALSRPADTDQHRFCSAAVATSLMGRTVRPARHRGRIPSQMHVLCHVCSLHTVVTPLCTNTTITTYRSFGRGHQFQGRGAAARRIGGLVLGRRQREGALCCLHPDAESNPRETIVRDRHSLTTSCFGTNSLLGCAARLGEAHLGRHAGAAQRNKRERGRGSRHEGREARQGGRRHLPPQRCTDAYDMKNAAGLECVAMVASHGSRRE